jgi:hypothetical protein
MRAESDLIEDGVFRPPPGNVLVQAGGAMVQGRAEPHCSGTRSFIPDYETQADPGQHPPPDETGREPTRPNETEIPNRHAMIPSVEQVSGRPTPDPWLPRCTPLSELSVPRRCNLTVLQHPTSTPPSDHFNLEVPEQNASSGLDASTTQVRPAVLNTPIDADSPPQSRTASPAPGARVIIGSLPCSPP